MTYNDYLDKADEIDIDVWTDKEIEDFTNLIVKEIQAGHSICSFAIQVLSEGNLFVEDVFDEVCDKGWNYYKRIFKIGDEYYAASILEHYMGDVDCDDQILQPVELRNVKVKKWVNKEEPIEQEQIYLVERFCRDTNCNVFEGVFSTLEKAKRYIFSWASYNVGDAKEYGLSPEDIAAAELLREKIKKSYTKLQEDDFEQSYFSADFTITKIFLI